MDVAHRVVIDAIHFLAPNLGAYLGLTIVLPITLLAFVSLLSAILSALLVTLSIGKGLKALVMTIMLGIFGLSLWAVGRLRRRAPQGSYGPLSELIRQGAGAKALGEKAYRLGRFAEIGPVIGGFALTRQVFQAHLKAQPPAPKEDIPSFLARLTLSRGLERGILRWARGLEVDLCLIRSSFGGEDGAGEEGLGEEGASGVGFPGVFESVLWDRNSGAEGLRTAMAKVWASRWAGRAEAYGELPSLEDGALSVLIVPYVEALISGVVSSVDTASGDGLFQLVEGGGGLAKHSLRTGAVQAVPGFTLGKLEEPLVRRLAALAIRGEVQLGGPVEMEWALDKQGDLYIHQLRPLAQLPEVRSFLADGPLSLPPHPLTPLARALLLDPIDGAFPQALGDLKVARIQPGAFVIRQHMTYIDVAHLKPLLSPLRSPWQVASQALRCVALALRPPRISAPDPSAQNAPLDRIISLRDSALRPLMVRQMALGVLMAQAPLALLGRNPGSKAQRIGSRFELMGRVPQGRGAGSYPWLGSLVARREWLSDALEQCMDHAASIVSELADALPEEMQGRPERLHFYEVKELQSLLGGALESPLAIDDRERTYSEAIKKAWPPTRLEDKTGALILSPPVYDGKGLLGFPLGGGVVEGRIFTGEGAPEGSILLLEDGSSRHFESLIGAAGVIFARGGALSHLALLCRERGIPGVVGAWEAMEQLKSGDFIRLDGIRGEVTPLGAIDVL